MTAYTDPTEARLAARTMPYPNQVAERDNVARVDGEVSEAVRAYETSNNAAALAFIAKSDEALTEANAVAEDIDNEILSVLQQDRPHIDDLYAAVARLETLRLRAEPLADRIDRAASQLEWHADKLSRPLEHYSRMLRVYSSLGQKHAIYV